MSDEWVKFLNYGGELKQRLDSLEADIHRLAERCADVDDGPIAELRGRVEALEKEIDPGTFSSRPGLKMNISNLVDRVRALEELAPPNVPPAPAPPKTYTSEAQYKKEMESWSDAAMEDAYKLNAEPRDKPAPPGVPEYSGGVDLDHEHPPECCGEPRDTK